MITEKRIIRISGKRFLNQKHPAQNRCVALPNREIMPEDNGAERVELPNIRLLLKDNGHQRSGARD
jgi:hypothetical protein